MLFRSHGEALFDLGIITGSGGDIKEADLITREEMVTILSRLLEGEIDFVPPATPTFKDVPNTHWSYKDVELAYSKGITSGVDNGKFGLGDKVNNNQAALFLLRSLGYDTKDIDYEKASSVIAKKYKLTLNTVEAGSKQLIRGQVFELLAKTLNMPTKDNPDTKKVALLKYKLDKIQGFEAAMDNVVEFKVKEIEIGGNEDVSEFTLKKASSIDKGKYMEYLKANPDQENRYDLVVKERNEMKSFINKYLSVKHTKLKITDELIENITNNNRVYSYTELGEYEDDIYWSNGWVNIFISRDDEKKDKINMTSMVESGQGIGESDGYVTEIREYKHGNGKTAYAVLGKERSYVESKDGTYKDEYSDFYFSFVLDSKGNTIENIGYIRYGAGYNK